MFDQTFKNIDEVLWKVGTGLSWARDSRRLRAAAPPRMKIQSLLACSLGVAVVFSLAAQTPPAPRPLPVQAGDLAPPLQVREWVKGAPIAAFAPGKVYFVEFWAVWCGPCIGNIPHLNALQKKYAKDGLVVVGFTSPDRYPGKPDAPEKNSLELVRGFVAKRGDGMAYHVAYDLAARETFQSYFHAEQAGIPHAFIVGRDGRIVIGGHPYYFEEVLADVMADRWDPVKGPERFAELRRMMRAPDAAKDYADFKTARAALQARSSVYYDRTLYTELLRGLKEGDADAVRRTGERMIANLREHGESGDMGFTLNQMVRRDPTKTQARPFLDLAGRMSEAYVQATRGEDPSALSLRAEWFVCRGDLKSAVETQRRAVAAEFPSRRDSLQARLAELEKLAEAPPPAAGKD
jgi:thiol-disulfide isomerase/thioredoxin